MTCARKTSNSIITKYIDVSKDFEASMDPRSGQTLIIVMRIQIQTVNMWCVRIMKEYVSVFSAGIASKKS